MKKSKILTLVMAMLLAMLLVTVANADTWFTANQSTISWAPVTTNSAGDPLGDPSVDRVRYQLYLSNAVTDPDKTAAALIDTIATTSYTFTLNTEGMYRFGVNTIREVTDDGGATWVNVGESGIRWSDDTTAVEGGEAFGVRYYLGPAGVILIHP